ncbi:hypothetical protein KEM60_00649 [Austwickia sp. TVS 96-490-7B]|uniref:hypothetical protein n=1 Tax=Austwickia sp. TVS 96-490-7B TaxID=2830843 RepID=UPI001C563C2C|nr:hypothetical protein [Austwickia sp. TVS 96-490-7B]MBW3084461.1 hypothetical protein [Austwickia sp. TVS 96-490-7B]
MTATETPHDLNGARPPRMMTRSAQLAWCVLALVILGAACWTAVNPADLVIVDVFAHPSLWGVVGMLLMAMGVLPRNVPRARLVAAIIGSLVVVAIVTALSAVVADPIDEWSLAAESPQVPYRVTMREDMEFGEEVWEIRAETDRGIASRFVMVACGSREIAPRPQISLPQPGEIVLTTPEKTYHLKVDPQTGRPSEPVPHELYCVP